METREQHNARKVRERLLRKQRLGVPPWNLERSCKRCETGFIPNSPTQIYCGSTKKKIGCSYFMGKLFSKMSAKRVATDPKRLEARNRWTKEYNERNKERIKAFHQEYHKHYYPVKKDEILKRNRQWFALNKDKRREYKLRRRALEWSAAGSHTVEEWEALKQVYGYACTMCFRKEPEIRLTEDHKIPISRGGTDYIDNIQPLCSRCNSVKATQVWFAQCSLSSIAR